MIQPYILGFAYVVLIGVLTSILMSVFAYSGLTSFFSSFWWVSFGLPFLGAVFLASWILRKPLLNTNSVGKVIFTGTLFPLVGAIFVIMNYDQYFQRGQISSTEIVVTILWSVIPIIVYVVSTYLAIKWLKTHQ